MKDVKDIKISLKTKKTKGERKSEKDIINLLEKKKKKDIIRIFLTNKRRN